MHSIGAAMGKIYSSLLADCALVSMKWTVGGNSDW